MARPLRIEFEGALYHVMARGNAREDIFQDNVARQTFVGTVFRCPRVYGESDRERCRCKIRDLTLVDTREDAVELCNAVSTRVAGVPEPDPPLIRVDRPA